MSRKAAQIILSKEECATLDHWGRSRTLPLRLVQRAKIIQMASNGMDSQDIAKMLDFSRPGEALAAQPDDRDQDSKHHEDASDDVEDFLVHSGRS